MATEIEQARRVLTADSVFDLIREDLRGVEEAIAAESAVPDEAVKPISNYLQQDGREHLRAALLLLCSRFAGCAGNSRMAIRLGAVVEMLHAATQVHGGAFEAEQTARGRYLTKNDWAGNNCVLAGDWLYLRAFRAAQQERVFHLVIGAAQKMVTAEFLQVNRIGCIDTTEADCLELADCRTACLFSACGKLGAVAAGAGERLGEKLGEFSWNLGMTFQLIDDMLDFASSEPHFGKPPGSDLKGGKVTLPLAYALERMSIPERNLVGRVLEDRGCDAVQFANVLAFVERYGGIERTLARARQFADRAGQILTEFPDSVCRVALFTLTRLVTDYGF